MKANVQYKWDYKTQKLIKDGRQIPSGYSDRQKKILKTEKHPPIDT